MRCYLESSVSLLILLSFYSVATALIFCYNRAQFLFTKNEKIYVRNDQR